MSSEVHSKHPKAAFKWTWRALDKHLSGLKELVMMMDMDLGVKSDRLVLIQLGKGKLSRKVEKLEDGLKEAKEKGLCKVLKLSFMRNQPRKENLEAEAHELLVEPSPKHWRSLGRKRVG